MTGAENLMNTVINTLSMIDRGFTVTLTVQPHNWDNDGDDYEEEDDDEDEPHVSDDVVEEIKELARRINDCMSESLKSQMFDHCEGLLKEKYSSVIRSMGDDEITKVFQGNWDDLDKPWPSVGDTVWYKTKHGNHEHGKVKVVCHNTIQLGNNVTLERKDCKKVPFEVGDEVYFDWCGRIKHGVVVENYSFDNVKVRCGNNTYCTKLGVLFDSVDEVLDYLKSTVDE